jgi:hypothetical protein
VTVFRVLAPAFGITLFVAAVVSVAMQLLDVSGQVAGLCFVGVVVLGGILAGRAAERWPDSSPRR